MCGERGRERNSVGKEKKTKEQKGKQKAVEKEGKEQKNKRS